MRISGKQFKMEIFRWKERIEQECEEEDKDGSPLLKN